MSLNFDNTEIAFASKNSFDLKKAHFLFSSMGKPWLSKLGISFTQSAFKLNLPIKGIIKRSIFAQFCGGETLEEADKTAMQLHQYDVDTIMDYGVEGKDNEKEYDNTVRTFLTTIQFASKKKYIPFVSLKVTGFCKFELLEKIHTNSTLTKEEENEYQRFLKRIDTICHCANNNDTKILIDAEESWIQNPIDEVCNLMMEKYNKERVVVFNTFQLYLHARLPYLKESFLMAKNKNYFFGAKLVRGAYMEKERDRAKEMNYASPVQPSKEACDNDYNEAIKFCIENKETIYTFIGTHNEHSCLFATQIMHQKNIANNDAHIYFSQLFGMSDNISFNLAKEGYHVAKYLPYGPVQEVIPYLMRRAQENTSVAGQTGRELTLIQKELKRRRNS